MSNDPRPSDFRSREIFVVDDDPAVRETLASMLRADGFDVTSFTEGGSLLNAAQARVPACILLDLHLPGRSGVDLVKELDAREYPAPIVVISSQNRISAAVDAMKHGAVDFIEKPFETHTLVRVREAIERWTGRPRNGACPAFVTPEFPGRAMLTPRELEVLAQIAAGGSNKDAARKLSISTRTVEVHRAHIMDKLGARNAAELIRIIRSQERNGRGSAATAGRGGADRRW